MLLSMLLRERSVVAVDRAEKHVRSRLQTIFSNQRTSCNSARFDTSKVTHVAIPIDEMPVLTAYSGSCTARPVVGVRRAGVDDIRKVGGRVIGQLEVHE